MNKYDIGLGGGVQVPTQFLYPIGKQFPFDDDCTRIVRELELRNWDVPGIEIEFSEYGKGEECYRMVSTIKGANFYLRFCRIQKSHPIGDGYYINIAGVTELCIPHHDLNVYEDRSDPRYSVYTGKDWEKDRAWFFGGYKSRNNTERQPFVQFVRRGPVLKREESVPLLSGIPREVSMAKVYTRFKEYFEHEILPGILVHPVPEVKIDTFAPPPSIPLRQDLRPMFTFVGEREATRIARGQRDPSQLVPRDRYSLSNDGWRLIPLDTRTNATVPSIAKDGFLWCGFVPEKPGIPYVIHDLHEIGRDDDRVVILKPNRANDIFVVDHAVYEKRREEIWSAAGARERLTDAEVADFQSARARTLVPINEYKGDYKKPIILVHRELDLNEVEFLTGEGTRRVDLESQVC